jgi:hypothetical protein
MRGLTRRGLAAICTTTAAAGGGYLLAAQTTAGAASPGGTSGSSVVHMTCAMPRGSAADAAASAAKRRDVEQLAQTLGVSLDRLGQATIVLKESGIPPTDPRVPGVLAQRLGIDPAVVHHAVDLMTSKYPFNQLRATDSGTAPAPGQVVKKSADAGGCAVQAPDNSNDPKTVALRGLARSLNVSLSRLMDGFTTTEAQGLHTLDDPRMPAALAHALGLDPATVQQAITAMQSRPPFNRGADVASAAGTRK